MVAVEIASVAPPRWDAYVRAHARASAYHLASAVRIGADAFGLSVSYLTARDPSGAIVGVLPLVEQSSLAFGRYLVSLPFFTYGGILADDDAIAGELARAAADLGRERRVDHVELRHAAPIEGLAFPERLDKVSMVLDLPQTEDALSKALGAKLRSQIRRAERENPEVLWGGAERLPEFYPVFAATMHELGTPVYSRRFFEVVLHALADRTRVVVVKAGGRVEAAAIVVRHGASIEVPWAAATPLAKRNALNMRMYWEMLRYCIAEGARAFDFGRCTVDSGTHRFKAQWGARPVQLHWHYWMKNDAPLPKLNASNPKYARAADLWRRMPLWCANFIGPYIVRNLP